MADFDDHITQQATSDRPRYRQPLGMPLRDEGRRAGAVVSVVVHALIIFLLIVPFFMPRTVIERLQQGAGGPGPAGGGGGGMRGTGGHIGREDPVRSRLARAGANACDAAADRSAQAEGHSQGRAAQADRPCSHRSLRSRKRRYRPHRPRR